MKPVFIVAVMVAVATVVVATSAIPHQSHKTGRAQPAGARPPRGGEAHLSAVNGDEPRPAVTTPAVKTGGAPAATHAPAKSVGVLPGPAAAVVSLPEKPGDDDNEEADEQSEAGGKGDNNAELRKVPIIGGVVAKIADSIERSMKGKANQLFITHPVALPPNTRAAYNGVGVTEWSEQGKFDFVVSGHHGLEQGDGSTGARNVILHYDAATKTMQNVADDLFADGEGRAFGVAACDVDGDGREEVFFANAKASNGRDMWFKGGGSSPGTADPAGGAGAGGGMLPTMDLLAETQMSDDKQGISAACLDRYGYHKYGVVVSATSDSAGGSTPLLYEKVRGGKFKDTSDEAGLRAVVKGEGVAAGLILGDMTDVFMTAGEHTGNVYMRNKLGVYEDATAQLDAAAAAAVAPAKPGGPAPKTGGGSGLADPDDVVHGTALCDVNSDGRMDIVTVSFEGPVRIHVQNDRGVFEDQTDVLAPEVKGMTMAGMGVVCNDFNNDGYNDIFVNCYNEANRVLQGQEDTSFKLLTDDEVGEAVEARMHGTGVAAADVDGDGTLDLLVAHGQESSTEDLSMYQSRSGSNGWLRVLPLTKHGAPARGASVWFHLTRRPPGSAAPDAGPETAPEPVGTDPVERARQAEEDRERAAHGPTLAEPPALDAGMPPGVGDIRVDPSDPWADQDRQALRDMARDDYANRGNGLGMDAGGLGGDPADLPESAGPGDNGADSDIIKNVRLGAAAADSNFDAILARETAAIRAGASADTNGGGAVKEFDGDASLNELGNKGKGLHRGRRGARKPALNGGEPAPAVVPAVVPAAAAAVPLPTPGEVSSSGSDRVMVKTVDAGSGYMSQSEPVAHMGLGTEWEVKMVEIQWPDGAKIALSTDLKPNSTLRVPYPSAKFAAPRRSGPPHHK